LNEIDKLKQQLESANSQLYCLLRQCQGQQKEIEILQKSLKDIIKQAKEDGSPDVWIYHDMASKALNIT
jgi:peptidoglycan hydrolase CwlO-like protein